MRKFWIIASTCIFLFTTLAHAQQIDIAVGWSTLESPYKASDLVNFHPPLEKGGFFPNVSLDVVRFKHRLGFNVETAWRYKQASYYGYENYRPIFTDVNALFQPKLPKKFGLDISAGVGIASNLFDQLSPAIPPDASTSPPAITSWKISEAASVITFFATSLCAPRVTTTTFRTTCSSTPITYSA